MAAFEIHMLERPGAEGDYDADTVKRAADWHAASSEADRQVLLHSIMSGLPGAYDRYDIAGLRRALAGYAGIGREDLRAHFKRFLDEVVPAAEELGVKLCVHPDDPPRDILGLPRIVSNADDIAFILGAQDSPANGLTFCTGSLGANPKNDLPAMARRFAGRVRFAHLRNVSTEPDGSFEEAAHLGGDTDMPAVIAAFLAEERRTGAAIPFRPDHGHALLDDDARGTHPGYPLVGRLRGLAELRGVIAGLSYAARAGV
jgi:mannonate dehydratase